MGIAEARNERGGEEDNMRLQLCGERGLVTASMLGLGETNQLTQFLEQIESTQPGAFLDPIDARTPIEVIVEPNLGEFGAPDLMVVAGQTVVIIEAKLRTYVAAAADIRRADRRGFNSSINGQLMLKQRFHRALQRYHPNGCSVQEDEHDPRPELRRRKLAQRTILRNIVDETLFKGRENIGQSWFFVALTDDAANPWEAIAQNTPWLLPVNCPLQENLNNETVRNRWLDNQGQWGWIGWETVLDLVRDVDYVISALPALEHCRQTAERMRVAAPLRRTRNWATAGGPVRALRTKALAVISKWLNADDNRQRFCLHTGAGSDSLVEAGTRVPRLKVATLRGENTTLFVCIDRETDATPADAAVTEAARLQSGTRTYDLIGVNAEGQLRTVLDSALSNLAVWAAGE